MGGADVDCMICAYHRTWPLVAQAKADAVWHTYEVHRTAWEAMFGTSPPTDPRPDTIGYEPSAN